MFGVIETYLVLSIINPVCSVGRCWRCGTISAIGLNKILQYRMICLIECLDQVGMLFLSDLSRQKCTMYTGQQGFDVPDSPTGHGEGKKDFRRQQTQMERSPDVSDTRSHCRQSTRNQTTRARTAFRVRGIYRTAFTVRGVSHFTECADNQKTRLVVGTNKDLAVLRVRGEGQHNTIRVK